MNRLESWFQRHYDRIIYVASIAAITMGLCLGTGVIGPTLDARAQMAQR